MTLGVSIKDIIEKSRNPLLKIHPSWKRIPLVEVADILNGFAFKSKYFNSESGIPLLRIRDINNSMTKTYYTGKYDASYFVEPGDLVIGMDGDFNCVRWLGPRALLNQRVCKLTIRTEKYNHKFLEFVLPAYLQEINENTSSVTVKHLSSRTVAEIPLPFPPVNEQERIVARIEELFTQLDAGTAALRRVQAELKRYKASVLKAACEGRLFGEKVTSGKLPQGWEVKSVKELTPPNRKCAYGVLQPGVDKSNGVLFIRVGDINEGIVDVSGLKRIDPGIAKRYPRTKLQGGEIVITLVGAIGRTAVVPASIAGANTARAVGVIPISEEYFAPWVEIFFRNPEKIHDMTSKAHEVARKTLNLEDVREAKVSIPPFKEQKRIVTEVERRFSVEREIEGTVDAALMRAARLRQSILRSAFDGRLI